MKILILGGDGYLGWPTAMNLSNHGHEVMVVDNYLRRKLVQECGAKELFEVPDLNQRLDLWRDHSGHVLKIAIGDLLDWDFIEDVFKGFPPDAVIHYAEQPSGPYSMHGRREAALTLTNNLGVTFNVIQAVHEFVPECHIVKLGTMGEYGTPNIDIEEGWINIEHKGRSDRFLYPRQSGSLYHTTKIMDTDLLWYYTRLWNLRVTDLMQGPVYGLETAENQDRPELYSFFNYDDLFGTVLNRFIVQAAAGYPLTVYGAGGQTRGYLNIRDTLTCVQLSVENPPQNGELRIYNQFTETFSVNDLANRVRKTGDSLGLSVKIDHLANARLEREEHYYNPVHQGLVELGLEPNLLTDQVLLDMFNVVLRYRDRIDSDTFLSGASHQ
ncbi:MAG: NAD-dependent epimerase/dehydratase family protein [Rhodospirillales bacterium]|nr:NAD-dependent epimerase/dehydratase family protein [Rhodospirillales bacterium]